MQGLVNGLREQIELVTEQVLRVTWTNYIHTVLDESPATKGRDRRQALVQAMVPSEVYTRRGLADLARAATPQYAQVGPKTLSRDLNRLVDMGLVVKEEEGWRANVGVLAAFLPPAGSAD